MMAVAWVLVALVERASAREAAFALGDEPGEEAPTEVEPEPPRHVDVIETDHASAPKAAPTIPAPEAEAGPETEPEPQLAVSEWSARAILASGPPPLPEPAAPLAEPGPEPERELEPEPEPEAAPEPEPRPGPEPDPEPRPGPEPEPEPVSSGPAREWSIWDRKSVV